MMFVSFISSYTTGDTNRAGTAYPSGKTKLTPPFDLQLIMQSVPITTEVTSSNHGHGEVYSIQHYVIKFVSDLQKVGGFLRLLRFPAPIKVTATI